MESVETTGAPSLGARTRYLGRGALDLARSEPGLTSLVVMAVAGIAIAGYLTAVHYAKVPLACSTTGLINCAAVTSSAYSVVPGTTIPITLPGILWFVVSGGLAATALVRAWQGRAELENLRLWQLVWSAAGLLFVLYLVYAEIVKLHQLCEWCTGIHLLTLATFLVALARWQDAQPVPAGRGRARRQVRGERIHGASTNAPASSRRASQAHGRHRAPSRAR